MPVVLGYNWLKVHNPNIDWRKGTLDISSQKPDNTKIPKKSTIDDYRELHSQLKTQSSVFLINAVAYQYICNSSRA